MSIDNAGTKWTPNEDDRLHWELRHGSTIAEIAKAHGRTELAVSCRIAKLIGINKSETQEENKVAKTTEQLFLEYARVIKMCEGTGMPPWRCVRIGSTVGGTHPNFTRPPEDYDFALAILEDRPVFVGDRLYFSTGAECTVTEGELLETISVLSWEKPKPRTFELNGQELPNPIAAGCGAYFSLGGIHYYHFNTKEDRDIVFNAVVNLLNTARDK